MQQSFTFLFILITLFSLIHIVQPVPVITADVDNHHYLVKRKKHNPQPPARPKTLKYATERDCSNNIICGFHCLFKQSYLIGKCNKVSKKCICSAPLFHKDIQEDPRVVVVRPPQ